MVPSDNEVEPSSTAPIPEGQTADSADGWGDPANPLAELVRTTPGITGKNLLAKRRAGLIQISKSDLLETFNDEIANKGYATKDCVNYFCKKYDIPGKYWPHVIHQNIIRDFKASSPGYAIDPR